MFSVGIVTVSTKGSKGQREDISGPVIREMITGAGGDVVKTIIIPDDREEIARTFIEWADNEKLDVIISTGGTGLSETDVTPEATETVIDRELPGYGEAMRAESRKHAPMSILSRAMAGVRGKCLIINLPGSPKAVRECLEVVIDTIPHAVDIMTGRVTEHRIEHGKGSHHGAH